MKLLALALCALISSSAGAQTVWRCGADGRVYSDTPCPDGRAVSVDDARSATDVSTARDIAARDRALAREMVQQRHEREREAAAEHGNGLAAIESPAGAVKPKSAKARAKSKKQAPAAPDTFRAVAPVSLRTRG